MAPKKQTIAKAAEPSETVPVAVDAALVAPANTEPSTPPAVETEPGDTNWLGERAAAAAPAVATDGADAQPACELTAAVLEPMVPPPSSVDDNKEQPASQAATTAAQSAPAGTMTSDASGDEGAHHDADVTPTQTDKKKAKPASERKRKTSIAADKPAVKRSIRNTRSNPVAA